jgi:hypothetical protein
MSCRQLLAISPCTCFSSNQSCGFRHLSLARRKSRNEGWSRRIEYVWFSGIFRMEWRSSSVWFMADFALLSSCQIVPRCAWRCLVATAWWRQRGGDSVTWAIAAWQTFMYLKSSILHRFKRHTSSSPPSAQFDSSLARASADRGSKRITIAPIIFLKSSKSSTFSSSL